MKWNILSPQIPTTIDELFAILLGNRKITNTSEFLSPKNPMDLTPEDVGIASTDLTRACDRIREACEKQEPIIIYGDYDCDGVCATAVLWETLYTMGCKVLPFIPHRGKHGYGLSSASLDEIITEKKPSILITVDNGIVAHTQVARLQKEGVFTILTDHHQPDATLPPADIIIHTTQLCGTTVAWMLAKALHPQKAENTLDLCAIATIADQVPLLAANRSFAIFGLQQLNKTTRLGLQILIETAGLTKGAIDAYSVNYGIAPRINAMGRLESALDALRALCSTKEENARALIGKLSQVNQTRQDLTQTLIERAMQRAKEWEDQSIIIIDDPDFHEGVIGLLASKLTETFSKPSICIARGEQTGKASCRSVPGVHITEMLRQVRDILLEVGGHPMAAGFKIETATIPLFKERMSHLAKATIDKALLTPQLTIDCVLPPSLLTVETAQRLTALEPYGSANRQPLFVFEEAMVTDVSLVGKEGKHLKLRVQFPGVSQAVSAIGFGMGEQYESFHKDHQYNLVGQLSLNLWKNQLSLQIVLRSHQSMEM